MIPSNTKCIVARWIPIPRDLSYSAGDELRIIFDMATDRSNATMQGKYAGDRLFVDSLCALLRVASLLTSPALAIYLADWLERARADLLSTAPLLYAQSPSTHNLVNRTQVHGQMSRPSL